MSESPKERLDREILSSGKGMREWYREIYLWGDHWKCIRSQKLESVGRKCEKCGETESLDVHHLRYKSIFNVELKDLQVLCRAHHFMEHQNLDKKKAALNTSPKAKEIPHHIWDDFLRYRSLAPRGSGKGIKNWAINMTKRKHAKFIQDNPMISTLLTAMKSGKASRSAKKRLKRMESKKKWRH